MADALNIKFFIQLRRLNWGNVNMKMFYDRAIIIALTGSLFIIAFDGLRGKISAGRSIYVLIIYVLYVFVSVLVLSSVLSNFKKSKIRALASVLIILSTVLIITFIPYTNTFTSVFYGINKEKLVETVKMHKEEKLEQYHTEKDVFSAPYPFVSYNGQVVVQSNDNSTKIKFYVYNRFSRKQVLVYASDDSGISELDFSPGDGLAFKYSFINKLDTNWYSATQEYVFEKREGDSN